MQKAQITHQMLDNDTDFQIIDRKSQKLSWKYWLGTHDKTNVDWNNMIVCGMADMEFKFCPELYQKFLQAMGQPHFGYVLLPPRTKDAILNWMKNQYQIECQPEWLTDWPNMFGLMQAVLLSLTKQGDQVLLLTPTYNRIIKTVKYWGRKWVQYQFKIEDGRFYFDFEQLQRLYQNSNIKLTIFINPHNPTGRAWTFDELNKFKDLIIKYKSAIYSDEIYSFDLQQGFIPLLSFKELHQNGVFGTSHTKTYNCSGLGLAYSFAPNPQIKRQLDEYKFFSGNAPNLAAYRMAEVCLNHGKTYRTKKNLYIKRNYQLFKQQCSKKLKKLIIYSLESTYLVMTDFKNYTEDNDQIKKRFNNVQVFPVYLDDWWVDFYLTGKKRTFVRINLALQPQFVTQIVNRLATVFKDQE